MPIVRTVFQPTVELEVSDSEAAVLGHQGYLWTGTVEELAAHYRDAGLEVPAALLKPPPGPGPAKTGTSEPAKGA